MTLSYFPQHDFIREIRWVLKPNGRVLFAAGMPGPDGARAYFANLATVADMEVESFNDLTQGAKLSIQQAAQKTAGHPLSKPIDYLPSSLQSRFKDILGFPGGERYELWQSGAFYLAVSILRFR